MARTPSATVFIALVARLVRQIFFSPTFFLTVIEKFFGDVGVFGKGEIDKPNFLKYFNFHFHAEQNFAEGLPIIGKTFHSVHDLRKRGNGILRGGANNKGYRCSDRDQ